MHPISDKDLDKLFQQRFENLKVEPSNEVWGKISNTLDNKVSGKQSFSTFWMAAASVIVVITAGLWFTRPVEKTKLQSSSPIIAKEKVQVSVPQLTKESITEPVQQEPILIEPKPRLTEFVIEKPTESNYKLLTEISQARPELKPAVEQAPIVIASAIVKKTIATLPKQLVNVPERYSGDQSLLDVTQADMITKVDRPEEHILDEERVHNGHKRIRSIASLVNFVIAKVDKREDKLIEFKDGVEGSEVSGINLGLVKIKSKK
jgi:hypothetical protein